MAASKTSAGGKLRGSKKARSKKVVDPMSRKEWYDLKVPSVFSVRKAGVTIIDRSSGTYHAPSALKGRTFEVNQADLTTGSNSQAFRKFKLVVDDVRGKDALSSFYGMELVSDKHKSIPKKWHSLIEAQVDVSTTDGYILRIFTIAITKKKAKAVKKTCYATLSQIKAIRQIIFGIVRDEVEKCDINAVIGKLMTEAIGSRIEEECFKIYPLQNCHVRKVKVVRRPKLSEDAVGRMHAASEDKGKKVEVQMA